MLFSLKLLPWISSHVPWKNQQLEVRRSRNPFLLSPGCPLFMGAIFLFCFGGVFFDIRSWKPQIPWNKNQKNLAIPRPNRSFSIRPPNRLNWNLRFEGHSFGPSEATLLESHPLACQPCQLYRARDPWSFFDRQKSVEDVGFEEKNRDTLFVWTSWMKGAVLMIFCKTLGGGLTKKFVKKWVWSFFCLDDRSTSKNSRSPLV